MRHGNESPPSEQLKPYTASGRVVGPDGNAIAGANVTWEGRRRRSQDNRRDATEQLAQTTTDAEGKFSLEAELVEKDVIYANLVVRAAGFGARGYATPLPKLSDPLEITLEPSYSIEGSIFTPNGEPVKDAQVFVTSMGRASTGEEDREKNKSWYLNLSPEEMKSGTVRASWPAPAVTDANGQFRFDDLVPRSARAELVVLANGFANAHARGPCRIGSSPAGTRDKLARAEVHARAGESLGRRGPVYRREDRQKYCRRQPGSDAEQLRTRDAPKRPHRGYERRRGSLHDSRRIGRRVLGQRPSAIGLSGDQQFPRRSEPGKARRRQGTQGQL